MSLEKVQKNDEFEKLLDVKVTPHPEVKSKNKFKPVVKKTKVPQKKILVSKVKSKKKKLTTKTLKLKKHLPAFEDSEGFDGRRPIVDPFVVGEKVELDLTYLNMSAGRLVLLVEPFVEVNGNKSYQFKVKIKSSKMFSFFYKLDNMAETYVDYKTLRPLSHAVHIRESKQIKEVRSFYDWGTSSGKFWEKKINDDGETRRKKEWKLRPFSQNLISAIFYMRNFTLKPGKIIKFNVADAGKIVVIWAKVLKQETIDTKYGPMDTVKIKVEYKIDGTFSQSGEIYFWFTNNDRKNLVKIQSKIKIGSLYGELVSITVPN